MAETRVRERKATETRSRVAEAALQLFLRQGYADTTIDQIAEAAGVSRRTVYLHFPTKDAMLLEHFVVRRDVLLQRLQERPRSEPVLVSLHIYLIEGRPSLVGCFDEVVATCVQSGLRYLA